MNGKELLNAVSILENDKKIPRDYIFESLKSALLSAYKKMYHDENAKIEINEETGEVKIFKFKTVKEVVENPELEISLKDARKIDKTKEIDDTIDEEVNGSDFGRVAASTAKQVMVQKIKEKERESIINEFQDKEGELITGVVSLEDANNYYIDLGRTNGILSKKELIGNEKIEMGSMIKSYVTKVDADAKGTAIILSRAHYNFVKRIFESEIPELADGTVMIYAVAREPGVRSKVAVASDYANIDPVGCCIGEHGSRISRIIKELSNEKIDIVRYDKDKETFIKNALAPAKNIQVYILDETKNEALVIADGDDFSLALGKKGQNVKLASRLTKYKIDVKTSKQALEMGISVKVGD